jgi:hypothetical protein
MGDSRRRFLFTLAGGAVSLMTLKKIGIEKFFLDPYFSEANESLPKGELFLHPLRNCGYLNENGVMCSRNLGITGGIFIDKKNNRLTKVFQQHFLTVGGTYTELSNTTLSELYEKEKYAYKALHRIGSRHIPTNIRFNDKFRTISMDYFGPDLSCSIADKSISLISSHHLNQMMEMCGEYRLAGFFKTNFTCSNLSINPGTDNLVAFDFKGITTRSQLALASEIKSLRTMGSIRNPKTTFDFIRAFPDFPQELIIKLAQGNRNNFS